MMVNMEKELKTSEVVKMLLTDTEWNVCSDHRADT